MTTPEWNTLQPYLSSAMALPEDEREAWLESQLESEVHLLAYAKRILRLSARPNWDGELPEVVSGWRILLPLGMDPLGIDFLAERADGTMERLVALKVSRLRLEGAEGRQQFIQEMRSLSMLYDANISRLLDSGWINESIPFIVSEMENGAPIIEAAAPLDLKEKVSLFRRVLTAVIYAHQRQILHGNLRPANVLVTKEFFPRLTDYGLAVVLAKGGDAVAAKESIDVEDMAYLSPEQVRGLEVNAATDVYALGLILYELVAGKRPYGSPHMSIIQMGRAICEAMPDPVMGLDVDLNYIIQKSLEKNREGRYPTVEAFAKDVDDYLAGRAVMPRQEALQGYVLRMVRKHWVTIVLVLAVFLAGGIAVFQQGKSQKEKANEIQAVARALMAGKGGKGPKAASGESSIQSIKSYLDDMLVKNAGKPEVMDELAKAYYRLAEVESKGSGLLRGDRGAAIQSVRKSFELNMKLLEVDPKDASRVIEYSKSARLLTNLLMDARDYQEALKVAQAWKQRFEGVDSKDPEFLKARAAANQAMADLLYETGDKKQSISFAKAAMMQFGGIFESDKNDPTKRREYTKSAQDVGNKALKMGLFDEALSAFKKSEEAARPAAEKKSEVAPMLDLARTLNGLGQTLEKTEQREQAVASFKEARQLLEQAIQKEANNEEAFANLADNYLHTARLALSDGNRAAALREIETAIEILRKFNERAPGRAEFKKIFAQALTMKAELVTTATKHKEGEDPASLYKEALQMWDAYGRSYGLRVDDEKEIARIKQLSSEEE